jgi:outer membrane protein
MNMPEFKQLETDMQLIRKQLTAQLESKTVELQRKSEEYEKGVQSGMLLPSIRADKEKELYTMEQSIQEFERSAQEDLQSKYGTMMEPINLKVEASINKVAAANNYTYIISTQLYSGEKVVLYSKSSTANDISLLVLKDLGVIIPPAGSTTTTAPTTTAPTNTTTPTTPPAKTAPIKK